MVANSIPLSFTKNELAFPLVGDNLKKIKDLERSLKELQAENDATKKKLSDLTTRVDSLQ